MAAVSGKDVADLRHFLKHVVGLDGAAAALHAVLGAGQDENGLIIFFPHPSGDDPGQALVAVRQKNDQHTVLFQSFFLHLGHGLFHIFLGHVLAAVVQGLQLRSDAHRLRPVGFLQKPQRPNRRVQPSRGVDAGAQDKTDGIGGQPVRLDAVHLHQRAKPSVSGMLHMGKAKADDDPVFIQKLHHVADRGKGRQLQKAVQKIPFCFQDPQLSVQAADQLVGDHSAADAFKRIGIPFLLRIHHRVRRREQPAPSVFRFLIGHLMMIRHDNGHALFLREGDLSGSRDPVVAGEDGIDSRLICVQHQMLVQPVAVLHPVRDRRIRVRPRRL